MSERVNYKLFEQYINRVTQLPIIKKHDISNMMLGHFILMFNVNKNDAYKICLLAEDAAYDVENEIVIDISDPTK